jgi:hypothetical protein
MAQIVIAAVSVAITVAESIYQLLHRPKPLAPMQDLQVSSSADGAPIPFGYGRSRFAGQLIWSPGIEYRSISQGGSGGSSTIYLYGASFAVAFGEGPGIIYRIWADAKLIYLAPGATQAQSRIGTYSNWVPTQHYVAGDLVFIPGPGPNNTPSGVWECVFPNLGQMPGPHSIYWTANTGVSSFDFNLSYNAGDLVFFFTQEYASIQPNNSGHHPDTSPSWWTPISNYWKPPTIYPGTQTQNPDALMQGIDGAAFTSAYRPLIYAVWDQLPLANFGNRIPNIRAEILFTKTNNIL